MTLPVKVDAMLSSTVALKVSLLCAVVLAQVAAEAWIVYLGMASRSTISIPLRNGMVSESGDHYLRTEFLGKTLRHSGHVKAFSRRGQ